MKYINSIEIQKNKYYFVSYLILLFIGYIIHVNLTTYFDFTSISPDSIRFMKIWQYNFVKYNNEYEKFIYFSLKNSSEYDLNRGRYIQYLLYGLEVLIRKGGHNYNVNYLLLFLIYFNNFLISIYFVKRNKSNSLNKILLFLLLINVLNTNIFFISSIIILVLYSKLVWITFVLLFLIIKNKVLKILFLILASFSDEFGLIFTIMLIFFNSIEYFHFEKKINKFKTLFFSFSIIIFSIFSFYGFSALFFNLGTDILRLSLSFGKDSIHISILDKFKEQLFILFNLITGSPYFFETETKNILANICFIFSIIFVLLIVKNKNKFKTKLQSINLEFLYWFIFYLFINFIALPQPNDDIGHYGYVKNIISSIFFLFLFSSLIEFKNQIFFLFLIILIHFTVIKFSNNSRDKFLEKIKNFFIEDVSVNYNDVNSLKISVFEFNKYGKSKTFENLNNFQEIDSSGTWYYSRLKNFNPNKKMHFPVYGTVKVMLWPKKVILTNKDTISIKQ